MSGPCETNVRLPACAVAALDAIAARDAAASSRRPSRDAALRRLLDDYVERQSALGPDDRLVHVATPLHYPLRRARPEGRRLPNDDVRVVPVRLRIRDPRTVEQARGLAFRLPGQPPCRGHSDYQARTLTDAVLTAIALEEPFADPFLEGLLPLLRQRAARELWHLVVELTLTRAERSALDARDDSRLAARTAELLDQDEQAWHHDLRVEQMRRFARAALSGPGAGGNEQSLRDGRTDDGPLQELADDLREVREGARLDLVGYVGSGWHPDGHEGRGGTAVWRAGHAAALEQIAGWLAAGPAEPLHVQPVGEHEGWALQAPPGWHAEALDDAASAGPWQDDVAAGRLILLAESDGTPAAVWPLGDDGRPVPRLPLALSAAAGLSPAEQAELLLMEPAGSVRPRIAQARRWGLLTTAEAAQAQRDATMATRQAIAQAIAAATSEGLDRAVLSDLADAASALSPFAAACRRHAVPFDHAHEARWPWAAPSLADAVADSAITNEALAWLGAERRRSRRERLTASQNSAWHHAIDQYRHDTRRLDRQP